jgi:hypothetical protein
MPRKRPDRNASLGLLLSRDRRNGTSATQAMKKRSIVG